MSTEPNNPIVLRTVKHDSDEPTRALPRNGIAFECPTQTKCPQCKAVVPLAGATPLSYLPCPTCGASVFVPGRVGGFLLYAHIGEGEMGAIYRATDESLFRDVAIKLVRGCLADDRESRERLRREACAAGRVNHPRVAQVHALNFSNGHPYLVMELVTGEDFAQKLEREGRIDERAVLRMALDVAEGLSALHREGLVHGDIKPGNIVLDRDGNAKLVDFGLSGMTRHDSSGNFVGTPDYIAPELLRGASDSHGSDLYSLGATLYHLLSGRPPFEGATTEEVLKARVSKQAVPLGRMARHVSAHTQKLVMRMLELHPTKRPANSDVVAADIRDALSRLDAQVAAPSSVSESTGRCSGRFRFRLPRLTLPKPLLLGLALAVIGSAAVGLFLVAAKGGRLDDTRQRLRQKMAELKAIATAPASEPQPQPEPQPAQKSASYLKVVKPAAKKSPLRAAAPIPATTGRTEAVLLPTGKPRPKTAPAPAAEAPLVWKSSNLGGEKTSGSTMQMGGTVIVQGTGTDMWSGYDRCRYVWANAAGNYALSAQVRAIADNNSLAVSGLLIKGEDPADGHGLLFGFLGTGELFFQIRRPENQTELIKRSGKPPPLPRFLQLVRTGKAFEASVSSDGRTWETFAACELDLPLTNTVGFCVSSQDTNTLAAAKFASVLLLASDAAGGPQTNSVSADARGTNPAAQ